MKKMMKKALAMTAIVGAGVTSWMIIKKKNPDAMDDMKCAAKKAATKMLNKLEDMDIE